MKGRVSSRLIVLLAAVAVLGPACGSDSADVASLSAADGAKTVQEGDAADVEAAWLSFTECLREQGLEVQDPVVDSKGIAQKPAPVEGSEATKKELAEAYDLCSGLIEGVTLEKNEGDQTEYVDGLLELAACLRGQGIDVDDPDVSADKPGEALATTLKKDWDSPAMQKAREVCEVEAAFGVTK